MKTSRRNFIKQSTVLVGSLGMLKMSMAHDHIKSKGSIPLVISTWNHGLPANNAAWEVLSSGGYALDAVEKGVRVPEADPNVLTVGYGGFPDEKGKVTLDACIMDENNRAGSVAFLQKIKHPISVARRVMENTRHVMLSGKGALEFALQNGFHKEKLLTVGQKKKWKRWLKDQKTSSKINVENHDTIGMLAIDEKRRVCGACTTSGLRFKMHGRVGDSPIIGAGLFVDGEIGGATATGVGELVMKTLGTFLVVELMRNGYSPSEACELAVKRIAKKIPDYKKHQVGFLALNKKGEFGAYCIQPGFNYALTTKNFSGMKNAEYLH